jgi:hypothetical protein
MKQKFSASSNGKNIPIDATNVTISTTLIHRAVTGVANYDEVWLYAINNSASAVDLTLLWGGLTSDDYIKETVGSLCGLFLVIPGFVVNNAKEIRAIAGTTGVLNVNGYVDRVEV